MLRNTAAATLVAALAVTLPASAPAQSRSLSSYAVVADSDLRLSSSTVVAGDLGVNAGQLLAVRPFEAPTSKVVASVLRMHPASRCAELLANDVLHPTGPSCGPPQPFENPLFGDLAATCGVPSPFPACGGTPVTVFHGTMRELPPGTYGDVLVMGGGGIPAMLVLTGGEYRFCNLRASRRAQILLRAPSKVYVQGQLTLANGSFTGPTASGVSPCSLELLVAGPRVRFSRSAEVRARVCAPNALLLAAGGSILQGGFVGSRVRVGRATVTGAGCAGPATTTTTTTRPTTTTTTQPPVCGNDDREGEEECDGTDLGGATCESLGLGPGTLRCRSDCTFDRLFCTCGNGTVDASTGEQCDPAASASSCDVGEECGAAGSADACTCVTSTALPRELCGNCLDDDDNGVADFEDPACCPTGRSFPLALRRGRIRPAGGNVSRMRLRTILARSGLEGINPLKEDVFLQLRPEGGTDVFCARIPAAKWSRKRRTFRFKDPTHTVASALGVDLMKIKVKPGKGVRLRTRARAAQLRAPSQGRLQVTVGFQNPSLGDEQNRCSSAVAQFRSGRKGRLVAP